MEIHGQALQQSEAKEAERRREARTPLARALDAHYQRVAEKDAETERVCSAFSLVHMTKGVGLQQLKAFPEMHQAAFRGIKVIWFQAGRRDKVPCCMRIGHNEVSPWPFRVPCAGVSFLTIPSVSVRSPGRLT